jgi:hypothetical protein
LLLLLFRTIPAVADFKKDCSKAMCLVIHTINHLSSKNIFYKNQYFK